MLGLIPCLLDRHLAQLEGDGASTLPTRQRYTWLWDEPVPHAAVEALVSSGLRFSGWDRDTYLRDFGHFFLEQLVPRLSPGDPPSEDPLQPRFDLLFGPRPQGLPAGQEWPFPGPLMRLEDIQTQLLLCFRGMGGPRWEPTERDPGGHALTLTVRGTRPGWEAMAIGMVETLAPRCGAELVEANLVEANNDSKQAILRLQLRARELQP